MRYDFENGLKLCLKMLEEMPIIEEEQPRHYFHHAYNWELAISHLTSIINKESDPKTIENSLEKCEKRVFNSPSLFLLHHLNYFYQKLDLKERKINFFNKVLVHSDLFVESRLYLELYVLSDNHNESFVQNYNKFTQKDPIFTEKFNQFEFATVCLFKVIDRTEFSEMDGLVYRFFVESYLSLTRKAPKNLDPHDLNRLLYIFESSRYHTLRGRKMN